MRFFNEDMPPSERQIYTVSQLNQSVAQLIEQEFAWIWVEGEISNLARPASGHLYFSLKDSSAQLRCAMFRGNNRNLKFKPENGQQVMIRGKVSLYQPRGDYQLIVDRMEPAGDGELQRRFEALKQQLSKEGLFDTSHKQDIPALPGKIGVITSPSGAAIRDVLSTIARRFPAIPVQLYPVAVQGDSAAPAICKALKTAQKQASCDVLLLVRGGGSLEDLWPFNEESVASAIYDCKIPVISGVGHEVDITIADYVADLRAATPTAAAEAVTPSQNAWLSTLAVHQKRLYQRIHNQLQRNEEKLQWLRQRLSAQHPSTVLQTHNQRLDDLDQRLKSAWHVFRLEQQRTLADLSHRIDRASPVNKVHAHRHRLALLVEKLRHSQKSQQADLQARLKQCVHSLNTLNPLNTLARGYSITQTEDGTAAYDAGSLKINQRIYTRLKKGKVISNIEKIDLD